MNTQKAAKWFGIIFILIGVLGFVPGITPGGYLLGIFAVNLLHNIIHLLSGIVALICAGDGLKAKGYFKIFGIVYSLVTVIGLIQGQTVLELIPVNAADNVLHLLLSIIFLALGFGGDKSAMASTPMQAPQNNSGMGQM